MKWRHQTAVTVALDLQQDVYIYLLNLKPVPPSIIIALGTLQYSLFLLKAHVVNYVIKKESQL